MEQQQILVQMAVNAWNTQITRMDKLVDSISDEGLLNEVSPGRNRVIYLLGHMTAVHDAMISLLGLGERQFAHLDETFIKNPDKSGLDMPDIDTLRNDWKQTNATLSALFGKMTAGDWFGRHTAMTDEDLAKEPTRNKLSVLLNRTGHVAYHLGQMVLAK